MSSPSTKLLVFQLFSLCECLKLGFWLVIYEMISPGSAELLIKTYARASNSSFPLHFDIWEFSQLTELVQFPNSVQYSFVSFWLTKLNSWQGNNVSNLIVYKCFFFLRFELEFLALDASNSLDYLAMREIQARTFILFGSLPADC